MGDVIAPSGHKTVDDVFPIELLPLSRLATRYRDREKRGQAMFYRREIQNLPSKLLINMVGTTGFEPATSSVSISSRFVTH
jgi:hypothetical protein